MTRDDPQDPVGSIDGRTDTSPAPAGEVSAITDPETGSGVSDGPPAEGPDAPSAAVSEAAGSPGAGDASEAADAPEAAGGPGALGPIDGGAVFAGWVGLGMALVIAIAFQLIIAIQALVFLLAPLAGLLIGAYANHRAQRRRPVWRVLLNAGYAGLVTGVGLAIMYVALRLLFIYADTGFRPGENGQLDCSPGPECAYLRYVGEGYGDELAAFGVVDGATFGEYALREQLTGGLILVSLTLGGALVAGAFRALSGSGRAASPTATGAGTTPVA